MSDEHEFWGIKFSSEQQPVQSFNGREHYFRAMDTTHGPIAVSRCGMISTFLAYITIVDGWHVAPKCAACERALNRENSTIKYDDRHKQLQKVN